ncbi:uncharacterized protein LOC106661847 isoform X2 [Cimex lectularius]|uniref:Uncharacterized protein n=1 Tax=Cimex lectularius TaxID=79782 RepID=A0A8I6R871_CIMLE|nr:uncharacterized protein LOC106661847 isoform X2 [Cimex lectularius]
MDNDFPVGCAYAQIALHADQVWWSKADYGDSYKLANLNLWIDLLRLNELVPGSNGKNVQVVKEPPPQAQPGKVDLWNSEQVEISLPCCRWDESPACNEAERPCPTLPAPLSQKTLLDPNWLLAQPWPIALLGAYPALSTVIKNASNRSLFSYNHILEMLKDGNHFPYTVDTLQELILHNKIQCDTVRGLWENEEKHLTLKKTNQAIVDRGYLNANVPEFYPSVLLPPNQSPSRFPSVFDSNYQAELFPYKEDGIWAPIEAPSPTTSTSPTSEGFGDWPKKGIEAERKPPPPNPKEPQPEPQRCVKKFPRILDNLTAKKEPENLNEMRIWLDHVYPRRGYEFTNLLAVANHYENLARQLALKTDQILPIAPNPLSISNNITQDRLLYRDVLTRKICEVDENERAKEDGTIENKFEELEREAIEQYLASDPSLVSPAVVTELSPEQEVRFQDLEREALEQYLNGEDSETAIAVSQESPEAPKDSAGGELKVILPETDERKPHRKNTVDKKVIDCSKNETCSPSSKKTQEEKPERKFEIPSSTQFSKHHNYLTTQGKEVDLDDTGRFDEYFNRSQERSQKGKWRHKKAPKKKKQNKRQHLQHPAPAVYCLEAETRRLATALKHKVLNYLKGVDLKLTEEKKKPVVKVNTQKGIAVKSIQETVRLTDIDDAETYRLYVREISTNAKIHLQGLYKRVRSEIMETTSKGSVALVAPTATDKRRVRKTIAKCVNLLNQAENIKKTGKKTLEPARRDVTETLRILHKTMDVVYALRDMSREAVEDVDFLKNGKDLIVDLYRDVVTLDEKSDYIRQRVMREDRSLLALLLFPRAHGLLLDRRTEFVSKTANLCVEFSFLMVQNELMLRCISLDRSIMKMFEKRYLKPSYFPFKLQHIHLCLTEGKTHRARKRLILDPKYWSHVIEIGKKRYHVSLNTDITARQAEAASRIYSTSKLPRISFNGIGDLMVETFTPPAQEEPRFRRLTGVWSDMSLQRQPPVRNVPRRSGSWPRRPENEPVVAIEEMRSVRSQTKTKKTDASCCLQ